MNSDTLLREISARMSDFDRLIGEMRAENAARRETMAQLKEDFAEMREELTTTRKTVDTLDKKIIRWEGKFGGFILVATCVWTFFMAFKQQILDFFKGG